MALRNKYENASLSTRFSEGVGIDKTRTSTYHTQRQFIRMVVLDVIFDPNNAIDEQKVKYWHGILNVSNLKYVDVLPRNTIIGIEIGDDSQPMFVFPFFPSHLALPCKPGEVVWTMIEDPEAQVNDMAYWMCKVTQPHHVDDVNHTHQPRVNDPTFFPGIIQTAEGAIPFYELRNGQVRINNGLRSTAPSTVYLKGSKFDESSFEKLVQETDGGMISQWESVPRFRKRPGDIALEGSNNTLIVLGTDRVGPPALWTTLDPPFDVYANIPLQPSTDVTGSAGSIDMVAGRGQISSTTGGTPVDTTSILDADVEKQGTSIKQELGKTRDVLAPREGDPDLRYDRSRVQISQRTNVDTNFGLSAHNQQFKIADSANGDAAVVIKTDKMRIIARSDVEILVTNYTELSPTLKEESDDRDNWASIVVKANGDIVFKPSKKGYIKLGGDDADKGIVCSDKPVVATDGNVAGPSLITTMGGLFAGAVAGDGDNMPSLAAGQAKFANKVLIK